MLLIKESLTKCDKRSSLIKGHCLLFPNCENLNSVCIFFSNFIRLQKLISHNMVHNYSWKLILLFKELPLLVFISYAYSFRGSWKHRNFNVKQCSITFVLQYNCLIPLLRNYHCSHYFKRANLILLYHRYFFLLVLKRKQYISPFSIYLIFH